MSYRIFISSVQREFAKDRKELASYIRKDAILGKFFDVFLFEEVPAQERTRTMWMIFASFCAVLFPIRMCKGLTLKVR